MSGQSAAATRLGRQAEATWSSSTISPGMRLAAVYYASSARGPVPERDVRHGGWSIERRGPGHQQYGWAVADIMKAEATRGGRRTTVLDRLRRAPTGIAGIKRSAYRSRGDKARQRLKLIDERRAIATLVLAADNARGRFRGRW